MLENKVKQNTSDSQTRPPVVVVMGHVDHGKTSLLDFIRKTKVAEKEAGGITQRIGAYQIEHNGKKITFIDTPGHEAFYAMRSRGAKVADIAVLVVAADDGIMPQSREAIKHIKQAAIPMIVAINKMDKSNADPLKVKNQLLEEQIVVEDYKGDVPSVNVSAKTGLGVEDLLEMVNLVAEVSELKQDTKNPIRGVVIESELDHKRGPVATLIIKEGILKLDAIISMDSTFGHAKILENFRGERIKEAYPGDPVVVVGLNDAPVVGEEFGTSISLNEAEERVKVHERKIFTDIKIVESSLDKKILNVILKSDVHGTLEALYKVLEGIESENVALRFLSKGVGEITESDIKLACTARALIVGFRTKINQPAQSFARQMKVEIVSSDIIYELVEAVRAKISYLLSGERVEVELGELKVLAIFRTEKSRMIVGGRVTNGEFKRGARARVIRNEQVLGEGRVAQLKIVDKVLDKVEEGKECGLLFEGSIRIEVGDALKTFEIEERRIQI